MKTKPIPAAAAVELRRRAEASLRERAEEPGPAWSEADTLRLVHELQVHQIELEMQNEELKHARDELEAGLEKYSDLYDFAPVGYLTLDREGTIREANLAAATLLGLERSRLIKQRFGRSVSATDLPSLGVFLTKVFASKLRERCEVTLLPEGKPPVEVRIEATVAAAGRECCAVLEDLTEHKRAERDRLVVSKLESLGMLAGGLAHDYSNLLTVIHLNLEFAQALIPQWESFLANRLQTARRTTRLAQDLTQQLVTLAQGDGPVQLASSLPDLVDAAVKWALSGSPVRCACSLPENLWPTEVDAMQMEQTLRNLVLNAREAMPRGGLISIQAENVGLPADVVPSLPPGDYVRLSIADQGTGITQAVLPRIFDPYFSTKPSGDRTGLGLGLTICHAVVQKHGGAIAVESEVGVGTTFRIHLPAARRLMGTRAP
jgi:two-component system cell cycle sensor histidine kinase/response regulator CckA